MVNGRREIKDLKTEEIIVECINAQRNWDDEYSKKKMLELSRKELKKRFAAVIQMLDDNPDRLVTDGQGLFKNVLLHEY